MKQSITCPQCNGKLDANPLGRWFAKFKCGHCGAPLQFNLPTNVLGISAAALFALGASYLTLRGFDDLAQRVFPYAIWAWVALLYVSYEIRDVVASNSTK